MGTCRTPRFKCFCFVKALTPGNIKLTPTGILSRMAADVAFCEGGTRLSKRNWGRQNDSSIAMISVPEYGFWLAINCRDLCFGEYAFQQRYMTDSENPLPFESI